LAFSLDELFEKNFFMPVVEFIQDLAIIMLVAGIITILFHRFKQPVVLGLVYSKRAWL
jgi:monovalent cation:H+ antiporter-2, CPA2 family